jgi:hypothetical protein
MVNQNILILRPKFNIFWAIFIRLFLTFNTSAEHHRKLNLPTFPHHKHDGSEDNESDAPFLNEVLNEVKKILG